MYRKTNFASDGARRTPPPLGCLCTPRVVCWSASVSVGGRHGHVTASVDCSRRTCRAPGIPSRCKIPVGRAAAPATPADRPPESRTPLPPTGHTIDRPCFSGRSRWCRRMSGSMWVTAFPLCLKARPRCRHAVQRSFLTRNPHPVEGRAWVAGQGFRESSATSDAGPRRRLPVGDTRHFAGTGA
jgi:hypothetical protein